MSLPEELATARLRLRRWRLEGGPPARADLDAYAALNADARVMEHFPAPLTRAESDASAGRVVAHFARHGYGFWVVEIPGETPFAGVLGLQVPPFEARFTPCVEIGWRLAAAHWGRGYATEGARAALAFAFDALGLEEVVAMTVPANARSRRVMEKLGMTRDPADDFAHPLLPEGHPLRRHVLYRVRRPSVGA